MQKIIIDCINSEPNIFFSNYLGLSNFFMKNHEILNDFSIINNISDRIKNIGKKVYVEINSYTLKSLLNLDYELLYPDLSDDRYEQITFAELYLRKFAEFLVKMESLGYVNNQSSKAWSEISNDNIDLYIRDDNDIIFHFSYINLHIESLITNSNSILSFINDEKEDQNIYSVAYEETMDTLDNPFARFNYKKQNDEYNYAEAENNIEGIFVGKMLFRARKIYKEMLKDIPNFIGISEKKLPIKEILDGKRVYITRSDWKGNTD